MSIGVRLTIDVTKIDKELLHVGKKGKYLDATVFINPDESDQYGNHGMIAQEVSKEAREAGEKGAILGNAKVFWQGNSVQRSSAPNSNEQAQQVNKPEQGSNFDDFDDDIPF